MECEITVKVSDGEKTIEFPWEDVREDFLNFIFSKADPAIQESFARAFRLVEGRIRCVFLDHYKKHLIQ